MTRHRREFLAALAAGVTGSLAGCGGDGGGGDGDAGDTQTEDQTPSPTATATDTPTPAPTATATTTSTATATEAEDADQEVLVGPGDFVFEPATFSIPAGSTVRWVWESSNHNVKAESTPDGSDWAGTPGGSQTFETGHTYSATFEVPGEYAYFCQPHRSLGMDGSFTVTD